MTKPLGVVFFAAIGLAAVPAFAINLEVADEGAVYTSALRLPELSTLENVTVITEEEIARSRAKTLPELLITEAGLEVTDYSGYRSQPLVIARGYTAANRITVLVDGVPCRDAGDGSPEWLHLPLDLVRRIEVRRGPSVLQTGAAAGATVAVFLKDGLSQFTGEVRATVEPEQGMGMAVTGRGVEGNLNLAVAARRDWEDGWRSNGDVRGTELAVRGGLLLSPESDLSFGLRFDNDAISFAGPLTTAQADLQSNREQSVTPDDGEESEHSLIYLRYQRDLSPRLRSEHTLEFDLQNGSAYLGGGERAETDREFRTRHQATWTVAFPSVQHQVVLGGEVKLGHLEQSTYLAPWRGRVAQTGDATLREVGYGVFIRDHLQFAAWPVFATLGMRFDMDRYRLRDNQNEANSSAVHFDHGSPELALGWQYRPDGLFFGRISRSTAPPTAAQLSPLAGTGGNPLLIEEYAENWELGVRQTYAGRFDGFLTWHTSEVKNELVAADSGLQVAGWRNETEIDHRGLELGAALTWPDDWRSFLTYTYTEAKFTTGALTNRQVPLVPRRAWHGGLEYYHPTHWFDAGIYGHYASGCYFDDNNTQRLPARVTWDLKGNLYLQGDWELYAQALNLFDRKYDISAFIGPADGTDYYYPASRRQFRFGGIYRF